MSQCKGAAAHQVRCSLGPASSSTSQSVSGDCRLCRRCGEGGGLHIRRLASTLATVRKRMESSISSRSSRLSLGAARSRVLTAVVAHVDGSCGLVTSDRRHARLHAESEDHGWSTFDVESAALRARKSHKTKSRLSAKITTGPVTRCVCVGQMNSMK